MDTIQGSLYDLISQAGRDWPGNVACDFMGKKYTFTALLRDVDTVAAALVSFGIRKGDVLAVAMPNLPQAVIFLYAANKIGAVCNMIHPLSSADELEYYVTRMKSRILLIQDTFFDKVRQLAERPSPERIIVANVGEALPFPKKALWRLTEKKNTPAVPYGPKVLSWKSLFSGQGAAPDSVPVSHGSDDVAVIISSGGTTGKAKGVELTNRNVNISAATMRNANPMFSPDTSMLNVLPIFHGYGLIIGVHLMMSAGATVVLCPRFHPLNFAKTMVKQKCNFVTGVPAMFSKLTELEYLRGKDLSFLRGVYCGSDCMPVMLERKVNAFLAEHGASVRVRQGYGMTEGGISVTLNPHMREKEGSVGLPLEGVSLQIVEPGTEKPCKPRETGEIVFSSDMNMKGYYEEPEETAAVLRQHSDGRKWIHSGDLGYVDEEGYLFFRGRSKRMIVTNGYNVYPNQLEEIIASHPLVAECCVIGVPDRERGSRIKAYIVPKIPDCNREEARKELKQYFRKKISGYALPREIEFIDIMPKTKLGKLDFQALEQRNET